MNLYEKVMIIDHSLDDAAANETVEKVKNIIIKEGGEILKSENWGRRKLSYELNKHEKGNYMLLLFKAPSSTIAELEKSCRVMDPVIKFMVVRITKKKQEAALLSSLTEKAATETPAPVQPPVKETPAETAETESPGG